MFNNTKKIFLTILYIGFLGNFATGGFFPKNTYSQEYGEEETTPAEAVKSDEHKKFTIEKIGPEGVAEQLRSKRVHVTDEDIPPALQVVDILHDALLINMLNAEKDDCIERRNKLALALDQVFNMERMAKLALGSHWKVMSEAERNQFLQLFKELTYTTYAARFNKYNGEEFLIIGTQPAGKDAAIANTRLRKSDGEEIEINYLLKINDLNGKYQVIDVFLRGNISELATRRTEYASIIKNDGVNGLANSMSAKILEQKCREKNTVDFYDIINEGGENGS